MAHERPVAGRHLALGAQLVPEAAELRLARDGGNPADDAAVGFVERLAQQPPDHPRPRRLADQQAVHAVVLHPGLDLDPRAA
ncbi:MAG TPA: hypothetical protein VFY87_24955, partial [Geminicoccaceae bacterium]|nr:hypothetical protein [Geminicoccaceae bacterium]